MSANATTATDGATAPVWKALADPTRRTILDVLRQEPLPVGKLAAKFEMTRYGVMAHLRVLQEAGLVVTETRGRERWNRVNPAPIRALYRRWIKTFEEDDADRLLRLARLAESDPKPETQESDPMNSQATLSATQILVEVTVNAPIERTWKALVEQTSDWWHADFFTRPGVDRFVIEPKLGGHMYEDWGQGQGQIWGTVNGIGAPTYLQVIGDQSKEWGGPSRGIMTWTLEEVDGGTKLRLDHNLYGELSDSVHDSLESGWQLLFGECLKNFVEGQGA